MTSPEATTPRMRVVAAAVAVGAATTGAVAGVPALRFAYESLEIHVALESAQGVVAVLLAFLAYGRFRLTGQLQDLILIAAFVAFGVTNLFVFVLPIAFEGQTVGVAVWMAAGLRLVAAVALAIAALARDHPVDERRGLWRTAGAGAGALVVVAALAALADAHLAPLIDPSLSPEDSSTPLVAGHPVAVTIQVAGALLMALAATAFTRSARRTGDHLVKWLAAGAALGTFARINYVLFPSLYTEWFYTGDLLRFGSYLLFLVGAAREIDSYWRSQAAQAVMEERRRVARELHDGLTQELAFIHSHLAGPPDQPIASEMVPFVREAADRALVESRRAVEALIDAPEFVPVADALRRAAESVAVRAGAHIAVVSRGDVVVDPTRLLTLERIVAEAVQNATRHGARHVVIDIERSASGLNLSISDHGPGFDPAAPPARGFGLVSMRERAESLGGTFTIESSPGRGTVIGVQIPLQETDTSS